MDKIAKALARLSPKEKSVIKEVLEKITSGNCQGLDTQKLKGHSHIFRVRQGRVRIIYQERSGKIFILTIERRNDHTYNF